MKLKTPMGLEIDNAVGEVKQELIEYVDSKMRQMEQN